MKSAPSLLLLTHPDFSALDGIRADILERAGGQSSLEDAFPALVQNALEFVLDPVSTGRTRLELLDNVEKTFVGLKTEHFFRDFLDVPKGVRDLVIGGLDVDVKNTVGKSWMIPQESYSVSGPCVLIKCDEEKRLCSLGLFLARPEYLNKPNRDNKRSVSKHGRRHILWLIDNYPFPQSHWAQFDMAKFRELRKMKGGTKRAAQFFRDNLRKHIHRKVILSLLYDQDDPMKRIRENGGARDYLRKEKIAVLTGAYDREILSQLKITGVGPDETMAVSPLDPGEEQILQARGVID
jgi:hypothetical protein